MMGVKGVKICKICGKEYPACASSINAYDNFRWQDVACCEEHGRQYFNLILQSRGLIKAEAAPEKEAKAAEKPQSSKPRQKKAVPVKEED